MTNPLFQRKEMHIMRRKISPASLKRSRCNKFFLQSKKFILNDSVIKTHIFDLREQIGIWRNADLSLTPASAKTIRQAAALLREGKTVAFPTETVYGLGADALNEKAVKKIFEAKGRPADNPLIVHIADRDMLYQLVQEVPEKAFMLMDIFWPGSLSIILNKKPIIPDCVTAGGPTVAIRMPANEEARLLIAESGCPIAAPSANLSGKPSPTRPEHVLHDLMGRVDGIVLGGNCSVGLESTVIDMTSTPPVILRPGIVTKQQIETVIGPVQMGKNNTLTAGPKSPGMKYPHYAPDAPMELFTGTVEEMVAGIRARAAMEIAAGKNVGIMASDETIHRYRDLEVQTIRSAGSRENLKTVAMTLFDNLRAFDGQYIDLILTESFAPEGVGFAIMNRMEKAVSDTEKKEKERK